MRYQYKVIKSESPEMKVGFEFVTQDKLHDDRLKEKIVELSDVSCRDYWLKLLKTYTEQEWDEHKNRIAKALDKSSEESKDVKG